MTEEQKPQEKTSEASSGSETYKCAKCGKIKRKDQGSFVYGGTTFCCEECCKKDGEKLDNVCEFC